MTQPSYRPKIGDTVRTPTMIFGRVEGWQGRGLVRVRITSAKPDNVEWQAKIGQVAVFTPDRLTLVKGIDE